MQFIECSSIMEQLKSILESQCGWPAVICFHHMKGVSGHILSLAEQTPQGRGDNILYYRKKLMEMVFAGCNDFRSRES